MNNTLILILLGVCAAVCVAAQRIARGKEPLRSFLTFLEFLCIAGLTAWSVMVVDKISVENSVLRVLARSATEGETRADTPVNKPEASPLRAPAVSPPVQNTFPQPDLDGTSKQRLRDDISVLKGKKITIWELAGNEKSKRYAGDLSEVFRMAGWQVESLRAVGKVPLSGLILRAKNQEPPEPITLLLKALRRTTLNVHYLADSTLQNDETILIVGDDNFKS